MFIHVGHGHWVNMDEVVWVWNIEAAANLPPWAQGHGALSTWPNAKNLCRGTKKRTGFVLSNGDILFTPLPAQELEKQMKPWAQMPKAPKKR